MAEDAPAEPTRPADEQSRSGDEPDSLKTEPTPKKLEDDEVTGKSEEYEKKKDEIEEGEVNPGDGKDGSHPPLPDEEVPPLPDEPVPGVVEDDGWDAMWDDNSQAYYFYNRVTGVSQWENPRVPDATASQPGASRANEDKMQQAPKQPRAAGGYDPSIHGDYDPTAWYAQRTEEGPSASTAAGAEDPNLLYTATGTFNRFTGQWQSAGLRPENFNDENKSYRQLNAFFDVDAAANSHEGKSLKAERSGKKLTKKELKAFREKRRERKEEKRRAWLRD
ncbi:TPA_exp: Uncharacterized protein A8136_6771 [Trichophyton benhamiae CBS 112371]|uniref:WW domain-containing protein n=1 Tax=Arthroderma benhamiae (strain ATCC MYA-4681 / CBS 112371) TaxID=663331 RepID=D4ARV9_ARTBC|nr:uncharacterized protein ARB_06974 [Trichophyton benhamiae CBS 112371]EFE34023.1 hypothetical protein ARB_06974 [Trichophyton benhamiae CBS 112371]DAA77005.1 TPA_exp: Uncharacterized protein A8136_6771 [Trichophyton benhamiae CBS 112371]